MIWIDLALWFIGSFGWALYIGSCLSNDREVISLLDIIGMYHHALDVFAAACPEENDNPAVMEATINADRMLSEYSKRYAP